MKIDFQVIRRYLEGQERKGDKEQMIDWFSDIRFEKDIREKYRIYWDELARQEESEELDGSAILGRIYHKIKNEEFRNAPVERGIARIFRVLTKAAAILFVPLAAYVWILKGSDDTIGAETSYSEIYAPLGTRTMFHLPDGSSGWLNGGSYLAFPTKFKGKAREVSLKGEAYFDVLHDTRKPFIVKGKHTEVIAYGTSFNVQAYPEDPEIRITLVTGKVKIMERKPGRSVTLADLHPGQMCVYYPGTSMKHIQYVDPGTVTAWKDGKLAFRDEAFTEVVKKINRWYNVELIIMDEELLSHSYQATFLDETLDEVLKLLQHSAPFIYKDRGREKRPDGTFNKREIEIHYKPN
jgi:ferric-dicitrate binding protein FerR (iron transport regulator)